MYRSVPRNVRYSRNLFKPLLSRLQMKESTNDEGGESFMYFITFSRKMGTNGSEIARRVADQLGYDFQVQVMTPYPGGE